MTHVAMPTVEETSNCSKRRGAGPAVSVIVPVTERPRELTWIYTTYSAEFEAEGRTFEFVFAVEPWARTMTDALRPLIEKGEPIRILKVGQTVGESALLAAACSTCSSPILVTLPPYPRVQPGSLTGLVREVENGVDLVTAVRISRRSSLVNRIQNRVFHAILGRAAGGNFRDIASGVRAMTSAVMQEVPLYGDFFRFLPILARREGFEVVEREVPQHPDDEKPRVYSPGVYLRRLIDVLGLFFLVRFTHKPLRFFGLVGSFFAFVGAAVLAVLLVQRLGGRGIADRPMLLLGALLLVLGVQAIAMGLIGEIIVHLSASKRRIYRVRATTSEPSED
jgi:dolichol-phosphate mannosyltransferase